MLSSTLFLAGLSLLGAPAYAALQRITDFGANPTGLLMDLQVPANLSPNPAVILALHLCGGSGQIYSQQSNYVALSEQKRNFVVIYPSATRDGQCWDVASNASLTRDGGGDSTTLANMVRYTIKKFNANPDRVFLTGSSSGCMMTNIMSATYPDLFNATSCYSGIPAGCLAGSPGSSPSTANPDCARGQVTKLNEVWASQARAMFPGYNGKYPRMQIFHGTSDFFVAYHNLGEQLKQWSAVHNVVFNKNNTDTPSSGTTQMIFGDGSQLVGYSVLGAGHAVQVMGDQDMKWYGL